MLDQQTLGALKAERKRIAGIPKPTAAQKRALTNMVKAYKGSGSPLLAAVEAEQKKHSAGTGWNAKRIKALDALIALYPNGAKPQQPKPALPAPQAQVAPKGKRGGLRDAAVEALKASGPMSTGAISSELKRRGIAHNQSYLSTLLSIGIHFERDDSGNWTLAEFD